MSKYTEKELKQWIIIALIALIVPVVIGVAVSTLFSHDTEDVRVKMEEQLYEKYGEKFVVDRIGKRSSRGNEFYQARIYPKSIVGTNKEGDDYYYGRASIEKESFGRLGGVADTYGETKMNQEAEEYLKPVTNEIFGNRVLLKTSIEYRRLRKGSFIRSYVFGFKEKLEKAIADPENIRMMLDLDVYIFERIEDDEEKEERRENIFEFVQYLQEEGLFEHLEMRIVFVDERLLAPSYDDFAFEVRFSDKEEKYIEEEDTTVELPPNELRERMSNELQAEIDEMSEEELLASMDEIRKDELNYNDLRKWNSQYQCLIYSEGMIKERYTSSYDEDEVRDFEKIDDVGLAPNLEYIYIK